MSDSDGLEQREAMSRARLVGIVALIIAVAAIWLAWNLRS
jgi:hypothetical protein